MTTEEKARAYAEKELVRAISRPAHPLDHLAPYFDSKDIQQAYLAGAAEALASQWVSVEERLPKPYEEVLTYRINAIDETDVAYHDGEDWYTIDGEHIRPHYWFPIPPLKGGEKCQ